MTNSNTLDSFQNNIESNSLSVINYYGDLKDCDSLYIEYTFNSFEDTLSIKKQKMTKLDDCSHVILNLDNNDNDEILHFRFVTDDGRIDDNNGQNFEKIINNQSEQTNQEMALVPISEKKLARKGLRFSYRLNKRIRLLLIKLYRKLPSFITGNYRRRINL